MVGANLSPMSTYTRIQSQIQIRHTRSGRLTNSAASESPRERPRPTADESSDDSVLHTTLIKDLRVKRVSTLTHNSPENENLFTDTKSGTEFGLKEAKTGVHDSGIEKSQLGSAADSPISADENPKSDCVQVNVDQETKLVLKPRKRVFKAPGSFSYRRMLPYLQGITKDNCMLEFCELPNRGKGPMSPFTTHKSSLEGDAINFSTRLNNVQDSSHESSCVELSSESPECISNSPTKVLVDQKRDVSNVIHSSAVEGAQPIKDHVLGMCTDDNAPVGNMVTSGKDGNVSLSEDQNVKEICCQSRSIMVEGYSCKDSEMVERKEKSNQFQCKEIRNINMDEQSGGSDENILNQNYDLNEESVQMTPPDAAILHKLEVEIKGSGEEGYVCEYRDEGLQKPSTGFNTRDATSVGVRPESTPKRKMALNPCSRLKLFRSPGSVSYRRMLPFIMDMDKSALVSGHHENNVKDLEQRQPLTPAQQRTMMDKSNGLISPPEPHTLPTPQLTNACGSSNFDGPNLTSQERVTGFQMHVQDDVLGKESKLETSPDIVVCLGQETGLPVSILCHKTPVSSPKKDGARTASEELPVTNVLSVGAIEDYRSSRTAVTGGGKPLKSNRSGHNSSENHATTSSVIQASHKGIFKRNPRGCRGLCTCLNCASFRLHAERAFEFSKNQMQDVEEVAQDLMKELSKLQKILEKSAATGKDHIISSDEVTSACRKASETENLARNRLGEMNYDLNIHCRVTCLHERRVRFANHIKGKVITKCSNN